MDMDISDMYFISNIGNNREKKVGPLASVLREFN